MNYVELLHFHSLIHASQAQEFAAQLWDPIRATRTAAPSGIGGTRIPAYQQIDIQIADHSNHSTFHGRITPDLFGMLDEALEHI